MSVDLNCHFSDGETVGAPDRVKALAFTYLHVERNVGGLLRVGADDGVRVWLDGNLLINEVDNCSCFSDDQFQRPLFLTAGVHRLLVEVGDGGGHWGFIARLTTFSGEPISGVHASLSEDGR